MTAFLRREADERLGILLVTAAAMAWSTAGYFTRLIPVGLWTMLVWRNVFGAAFITLYLAARRRRAVIAEFAQLGTLGWFAASVNGLSMICFLAALRHTSVANVAIIYATAPFIAAAIAVIWQSRVRSAGKIASTAPAASTPATKTRKPGRRRAS